jgi:two-component system, NtrC family, nitrogen regulation response regulator GlnG
VGGHQPLRSNVRVIAATHQNLEDRVRQGVFREDLFHRLNVIRLRLPPLRERNEDVPALAKFFLQKSAKELGVEPKRITEDALNRLKLFEFPCNVRQLENICHWLTVMAPAQVIETKDLPPELLSGALHEPMPAPPAPVAYAAPAPAVTAPAPQPFAAEAGPVAALLTAPAPPAAETVAGESAWLHDLEGEARRLLESGSPEVWDVLTRQFEARLIRVALSITRGRRIEAAQKLGIGRNTITRKIQELALDD